MVPGRKHKNQIMINSLFFSSSSLPSILASTLPRLASSSPHLVIVYLPTVAVAGAGAGAGAGGVGV